MDHSRINIIVCSLGLSVLFMLVPLAAWAADNGDGDFAKGWDLLKHKKYKDARAALETGMKKNQSNTLAHYYLADACRGLKDWACAEEHYETSLELDAKSSVSDLAKTRLRKAKVWRLLDEAKRTIADDQAPPEKIQSAQETLEIAKKLGLDDEQQAVHQQLQAKLEAGSDLDVKKVDVGQAQDMPMALIPAGEFMMGDDVSFQKVHRVYLDAFHMDKFEVTVGMYAQFIKSTGIEPPLGWLEMNHLSHYGRPVVGVDWSDAKTYCRWTGKRLPTEAEWEKAARGTDGRLYPWGNDLPDRLRANYTKEKWNGPQTLVPVGTLHDGSSPYGIYDMAGNVSEWVNDSWDYTYYKNSPARNPKGPMDRHTKVLRGGSWKDSSEDLRSTSRYGYESPDRRPTIGFRCAKTP
jgi:formylglycine-generating enzyme required for sulfatase activity